METSFILFFTSSTTKVDNGCTKKMQRADLAMDQSQGRHGAAAEPGNEGGSLRTQSWCSCNLGDDNLFSEFVGAKQRR